MPQAAVATFAVVGTPALAVSALAALGLVTSFVPLVAMGVVLSAGASYAGSVVWAKRAGSGDVLFVDLMLWGWFRRWRIERQLGNAVRMLGLKERPRDSETQLTDRRQVHLLKQLAAALEARHPDTHGHSRRVARHAATMAKRMGLPSEEVARVRTAAAVHDVGKIETPLEIMNKPGALTDAEFAVVKRHSEQGARMVAGLGDEKLTRMVRHHHERLDGTGYPDGLAGVEIPIGARIIAVADTFDAVTSARPYRAARRHREALALLSTEAGTQLDPGAARAFRGYYSGCRPAALWALLLNAPRQLIMSLAGGVKQGSVATAATIATVVAGNVAVHSFHSDHAQPAPSSAASPSAAAGALHLVRFEPGQVGAKRAVQRSSSPTLRRSATATSVARAGPSPAAGAHADGPTSGGSPAADGQPAGSGHPATPLEGAGGDSAHGNGSSAIDSGAGSDDSHGHSDGKGNSGGNNGKGNSAGKGNNGKGNSGAGVTLPEQASETAQAAIEKAGEGTHPPPTPPVPDPPGPPDHPTPGPPAKPPVDPPGHGNKPAP